MKKGELYQHTASGTILKVCDIVEYAPACFEVRLKPIGNFGIIRGWILVDGYYYPTSLKYFEEYIAEGKFKQL